VSVSRLVTLLRSSMFVLCVYMFCVCMLHLVFPSVTKMFLEPSVSELHRW